jgi:pyridoxal phosphate enzyme (YggS family)
VTGIADSIKVVQEKIERACDKAGRTPGEITLVAVTKTVDAEKIKTAIQYGLKHFGENYVQEAQAKIDHIGNEGIHWHMIGYVQTNKVKYIQGRFDFIHSVDRWELLEKLEKYGKPMKALFELNLSKEATKHGMDEDGLKRLLEKVGSLRYVKPVGLMAMAPYVDDPEKVRTIFSTLRKTLEKMNSEFSQGMKELSMGMSSDFEVAIEEGATMVRVGTALFGERI